MNTDLNRYATEFLLQKIESTRRQVIAQADQCKSLVHDKVLSKSQELDKLIFHYHKLLEKLKDSGR